MANELSMIQAINDGLDMHSFTASKIFDIPYDEVIAGKKAEDPDIVDKRAKAKNIGFGIMYGKTAYGLAKEWKCSKTEAQEFIDMFLDTFPGVRDYMDGTIAHAKRFGYVQTIAGRFRRLSQLESRNFLKRSHAERQALNTPIQGSAADIVKKVMILCDNDAYLAELECELLLQIHDELIFEAPEENAEECAGIVRGYMLEPYPHDPLPVEQEVEPTICDNWQQGK
jgi:DNA polymerase-1